ncbi:MAG TPA: MFS transporter [Anaerolineales bacterium]|nr:MFS transporter [Anaerolineales bacterium]
MGEYLNLLKRNQNFSYLWWGNVVSLLGDWFNLIASAALITQLTNSGVAISYLFLVRYIPVFIFSPIAGVIADKYDRRTILIVTDLLRAVTVLSFLLIRSADQLWLLYLLTAVQFMLSALFTPARSAMLANVVQQKDLVTANALDSFTWSTMLALGSFLGGIVAAIFGNQTAFVMDALTFGLSAWLISRIVLPKRERISISGQSNWLEFIGGLRYLWQVPVLLVISLVKAAGSFVWGAINVLEISYADQVYPLSDTALGQWLSIDNGGTATLGLIYVVSGLGTGLGPLLIRRWLGDSTKRLMTGISIGFLLTAAGISMLGQVSTLSAFLGSTFVRTVGTGTIWVFSSVLLQMLIPDKVRGRVFAFEFAILTLTQSLSIFGAGYAQDVWEWPLDQITTGFGGFGIIVFTLWMVFFLFSRKHLHNYETVPSETSTTAI